MLLWILDVLGSSPSEEGTSKIFSQSVSIIRMGLLFCTFLLLPSHNGRGKKAVASRAVMVRQWSELDHTGSFPPYSSRSSPRHCIVIDPFDKFTSFPTPSPFSFPRQTQFEPKSNTLIQIRRYTSQIRATFHILLIPNFHPSRSSTSIDPSRAQVETIKVA